MASSRKIMNMFAPPKSNTVFVEGYKSKGLLEHGDARTSSGTFLGLSDTPANFTGSGNKVLRVNSTPDAVEFAEMEVSESASDLIINNPQAANKKIIFQVNSAEVAVFDDSAAAGRTLTMGSGSTQATIRAATGDDLFIGIEGNSQPLIKLDQSDSSIRIDVGAGKDINIREGTTEFLTLNRSGSKYDSDVTGSGTAWEFDVASVGAATGVFIDAVGLTTGSALKIRGDSDTLTTGALIKVDAGSARTVNWLSLIENVTTSEACTLKVSGDTNGGDATNPLLAIGSKIHMYTSGTTGNFAYGTTDVARITGNRFEGTNTNCWSCVNEVPSATNPVFTFIDDADTGIGRHSADNLSLIAGALEGLRVEDPADLGASETSLWLYDDDNGTMQQVTVGADDSGGVGFKLLRIAN